MLSKPKDVKSHIKSQLRISLNSDNDTIFQKVGRQMAKTLRIKKAITGSKSNSSRPRTGQMLKPYLN